MNKPLDPKKVYDEIAAPIRPGDLLQIKQFTPPFVVVRVKDIVSNPTQEGEKPYMVIQAEEWRIPVEMGKMHSGTVRVVDHEAEQRAEEVMSRVHEVAKSKTFSITS